MSKNSFKDLILYEDDNYILINKPPFVSSLSERHATKISPSILSMARTYCPTAQACHRLDKETSGVMVISKHNDAYKHLTLLFQKRKVTKVYHALAKGQRNFEETIVDLPILKLSKKGLVTISKKEGKLALTTFNTIKIFKEHTLVECKPHTGRMHQIRIHLACLSAPIAGDESYGGQHIFLSTFKKKFHLKKDTEEQPITHRVALHAQKIVFLDADEKEIAVEAPYPKDFSILVKQLEKFV